MPATAKPTVILRKYGDRAYHVFIHGPRGCLHFGNVCGFKECVGAKWRTQIGWTATWFDRSSDELGYKAIGRRRCRTRREAVSEVLIETSPERR